MAKLKVKNKDNPKLLQNTLADGRISLYLEYYLGRTQWVDEVTGKLKVKHDRKKETLNLHLNPKARTPEENAKNAETLEIAKRIRAEKEQELKEQKHGYRLKVKVINFLDYYQTYIDNYTKADVRMIKLAFGRFKDFLSEKYPLYSKSIRPEQLNEDMMLKFVEYLQSRSTGEGAKSIWLRFKKVITYAVKNNVIAKHPCEGIVCKVDDNALVKDVLSKDEMIQLMKTKPKNQNQHMRNAFIFCLYTGLRFVDVKRIKYSNVDYTNKFIKFTQSKTANQTIVPLTDDLITLIGRPSSEEERDSCIFKLPSQTACLKALKNWVKAAGINKHITWHCARHN